MRVAWADRRNRWLLLAAGAIVLVSVLVWARAWLSDRLVPDPRMNSRLERANARPTSSSGL